MLSKSEVAMIEKDCRFVNVIEVAKLIRRVLRLEFPGVSFSVRSHRYAGGASVDVRWQEGTEESVVRSVVNQFQGSRIDGDYSPRPIYHFLSPEGRAIVAYIPPSIEIGAAEPEGEDNRRFAEFLRREIELVHFGAESIFCYREPTAAEDVELRRRFDNP
jgi:hypothetical protein